jgi:hypothetical protein
LVLNESAKILKYLPNHAVAFSHSNGPSGGIFVMSIQNETVIGIGEACRAFPPNGISDATIARFIQRGVKVEATGEFVKLETFKIGGRRFTSKEAIARFIAAQNTDDVPASQVITATQRRRQSEAARLALQEAGL